MFPPNITVGNLTCIYVLSLGILGQGSSEYGLHVQIMRRKKICETCFAVALKKLLTLEIPAKIKLTSSISSSVIHCSSDIFLGHGTCLNKASDADYVYANNSSHFLEQISSSLIILFLQTV
jgi:hypothetical protein